MGKATITDIAAEAGVSIATVSRAMHNPERVHPDTLDRVMRVIKKNAYSYNAMAANFSKGRSTAVALVVPSVSSSVFSPTIAGVQDAVYERGYYLVTSNTHYCPSTELSLLQQICEQRFAGILLLGYSKENEQEILALSNEGLPIIVVWEKAPEPLSYVGPDHYALAKTALEHLFEIGHRRLAFILGPFHKVGRPLNLYRACMDFINEKGLSLTNDRVLEGKPTMADGQRAMKQILQLAERPTAVFCNSDQQAIGAINAIRKSGLRVPDDISVCGFDDIEVAEYFFPPLTTVRIAGYRMGYTAGQLLLDVITKKKTLPIRQTTPAELVVRNSTIPCRD